MSAVRKPTSILTASGAFKHNPKRYQSRRFEPEAGGIGPAPDYLGSEERACWDEIVSDCAAGVWQSGDRPVLEMMCKLLAESRRNWDKFPARRLAHLISLFKHAGMTPADRSRVYVKPKAKPPNAGKTGLADYL